MKRTGGSEPKIIKQGLFDSAFGGHIILLCIIVFICLLAYVLSLLRFLSWSLGAELVTDRLASNF